GNKTLDNSSNLVTVTVSVNPKITMTINTPQGVGANLLVAFGTVDPGTLSTASSPVTLTVSSNRPFKVATALGGPNFAAMNLATSINAATIYALGANTVIPDTYTVNPDYSLDAAGGPYTATVKYTLTQQ
ncbi:MAG: hypothetical protein ACXWGX_00680, partial [Usitatibacter sp.]